MKSLHKSGKRLSVMLGAALVLAGLLPITGTPASAAGWSSPSFVRSIGGIGRPGVFAWGMAFNAVSQEVIVGDYLNFRVRRYDLQGRHLGDLPVPSTKGEVWATAVDPVNGDIYYSNNWDNRIERYDKNGNFIRTIAIDSGWNAWFTVDTQGVIWVVYGSPQSSSYSVRRWSRDGVKLGTWNLPSNFPKKSTIYGIDVAADGRVYLPDSNNQQIQVYSPSGVLERTFGAGVLGTDLRGMAIDQQRGVLYTSDASFNVVRKFSLAGDYLGAFGGTGTVPGKFNGPRQLDVDPATGDVWVADYGNWRFQQFTSDGNLVGAFPNPAQPAVPGHLAHASDAVVDPGTGDVWVADTYNQRFQRFSADGSSTGVWGKRGGTDGYGQNYPSTVGFDPVNRRVWVGQEEGRVIRVYNADGSYVTTISRGPKTPENSGYTKNVTDIDFWNGKAYVSDEQHSYIKVIDADTFEEKKEIRVYTGSGWSGAHGLAIDESNGDLFVASYTEDKVKVYAQDGTLKYTFGSSGSGDGQFRSPRDVAIVDGVVYVTDAELSRVQAFTKTGTYLGKFGGLGSGAYQFRNPMGIDAYNGMLYVSDVENGRITVFDPRTPRPAFAFNKPTVSLTSPQNGATSVAAPVNVAGTASSTQGIANVEVYVQRTSDGRWWDGRSASWVSTRTDNLAPWTSTAAPATTASFAYAFPGGAAGTTYRFEVVARNRQGTTSDTAVTTATLGSRSNDTQKPQIDVVSPADGAKVVAGEPLSLSGTAEDDGSIATVRVALQDTATGKWRRADGTWANGFGWLTPGLTGAGSPYVTWALDLPQGLAAGTYGLQAQAEDSSGKITDPPVFVGFTSASVVSDVAPPDAQVSSPVAGAAVAAGSVTIAGSASDDVGVVGVSVALKDRTTGLWLRPNGTWGSFGWLPATLANPGGPTTGWTRAVDLPAGSYALNVRSDDASGKTDPTRPFVQFTAS